MVLGLGFRVLGLGFRAPILGGVFLLEKVGGVQPQKRSTPLDPNPQTQKGYTPHMHYSLNSLKGVM